MLKNIYRPHVLFSEPKVTDYGIGVAATNMQINYNICFNPKLIFLIAAFFNALMVMHTRW